MYNHIGKMFPVHCITKLKFLKSWLEIHQIYAYVYTYVLIACMNMYICKSAYAHTTQTCIF